MYASRLESQMPSKSGPSFSIHDESNENHNPVSVFDSSFATLDKATATADGIDRTMPLTTSMKANQQPQVAKKPCGTLKIKHSSFSPRLDFEEQPCSDTSSLQLPNVLDNKANAGLDGKDMQDINTTVKKNFGGMCTASEPPILVSQPGREEVNRLKQELEAAQDKIARMDEELLQRRMATHAIHPATSSLPGWRAELLPVADQPISQSKFSESTIAMPNVEQPLQRQLWSANRHGPSPDRTSSRHESSNHSRAKDIFRPLASNRAGWDSYNQRSFSPMDSGTELPSSIMARRVSIYPTRTDVKHPAGQHSFALPNGPRDADFTQNSFPASRPTSTLGFLSNDWSSYSASTASTPRISPPITPLSLASHGHSHPQVPYQPQPVGTPLSPTALEFSAAAMSAQNLIQVGFWNGQYTSDDIVGATTNLTHVEPINYRRLLDKNMSCNWRYIVDKIVCNNDQQASIFLQQKLKVATPEQKFELIEAIISQAYALMVNRFGNFLVQRCFEHGTPEQIIAIANAIRGNTLTLSMDAFGCHVVQKAFDAVPEEYKAIMVHELLRRIPETVIHRYACHVWQKLFELRWSDSPPQIMKYVNEALQGMWHEVALGETGSLVVQNIFENCLEEDKRPCVNEVLASIDIVSHGQFGNWCIQHVCEHGSPKDKSCAIEHVLRFATEYSTDQFASKVVEKCLKVGGSDFLERYLDRVCEGRPDRPRMPLIDIAGDQYGNYLIQYILINANTQHRDIVSQHVRKHMVSLRGSKFGSRVAMLCSNPAFCTRPGPPSNLIGTNRYFTASSAANHGSMSRSDVPNHYR